MDTPAPSGLDRPLDADIEALLDQAIEPAPLDAATQARIKSKLLRRIAQQTTDSHRTLELAQGRWQPFGRGLQIKVLNQAEGGVLSYLVRIGTLRVAAGGFHLGRKDVLHDDLHSDEGALIYLRGAAPELAQVV